MPRLTAVLSLLFVASLSAVGCQAAERATMAPEDGLVAIVNASTTSDRLYEGQFCGGAAIAATQVVTAAHCVSGRGVETLAVAAGGLDVCEPEWDVIPVSRVDVIDRVAVLHLHDPLSTPTVEVAELDPDEAVVARGWGRESLTGSYPCEAKSIRLMPTKLDRCSSAKALTSTEGVFCARPTGEENTCAGDSGGPLYQEVGPRAVVVGLVEGGIGCEAMDDGVYTHLGGIALRFPQR